MFVKKKNLISLTRNYDDFQKKNAEKFKNVTLVIIVIRTLITFNVKIPNLKLF